VGFGIIIANLLISTESVDEAAEAEDRVYCPKYAPDTKPASKKVQN
jgi:hypothetical protein